MSRRYIILCIVSLQLVACLFLAGCGAGGSGGSSAASNGANSAKTTITGQAIKGPFVGARLRFFNVTAQGRRGSLLATVSTDDNGQFSTPLSMAAAGPVWVEAEVSRHRDEDTQQVVSLPTSRVVTYCVAEVRPGVSTDAPLTPFNHLAFRAAMAAGGVSTARMRAALATLSSATGVDVESDRSADLSTRDGLRRAVAGTPTTSSASQLHLGMYLAGMSRRARELGVDAIDYMLELGRDYEDGRLDGVDREHAVVSGLSTREMDSIRTSVDTYAREHAGELADDSTEHVRIQNMVNDIRDDPEPDLDLTHLPGLPHDGETTSEHDSGDSSHHGND